MPRPWRLGSMPAPHPQHLIQHQTGCAQADGAVGQVEGREVDACVVKVLKVDHVAVEHAVDHIAHGAAQNAGQGKAKEFLSGVLFEHPHHHGGGHQA